MLFVAVAHEPYASWKSTCKDDYVVVFDELVFDLLLNIWKDIDLFAKTETWIGWNDMLYDDEKLLYNDNKTTPTACTDKCLTAEAGHLSTAVGRSASTKLNLVSIAMIVKQSIVAGHFCKKRVHQVLALYPYPMRRRREWSIYAHLLQQQCREER